MKMPRICEELDEKGQAKLYLTEISDNTRSRTRSQKYYVVVGSGFVSILLDGKMARREFNELAKTRRRTLVRPATAKSDEPRPAWQ
jgi:hypothetical protein